MKKRIIIIIGIVLAIALLGVGAWLLFGKSEEERLLDFVIKVEEGRDVRVLQLTDTQIIDSSQQRYEGRLTERTTELWKPENVKDRCYKYIEDAIMQVKPDFIVITGDFVYGEFDDDGTNLVNFIKYMDSFKIPWSPVFGNHERECKLGAEWQCKQLEKSKYCYFKKGDTQGHGNYTVGIKQGSELVRIFYMMDSNGTGFASDPVGNGVIQSGGFTADQLNWLYDRMVQMEEALGEKTVQGSLCYHIPSIDFGLAEEQYIMQKDEYTIHKNVEGPDTDFGSKGVTGSIGDFKVVLENGRSFSDTLNRFHVDSVFVGHLHTVNTSIMYEGIRWTFGLKTGEYDSHTKGQLGGTSITFNKEDLNVEHVYY